MENRKHIFTHLEKKAFLDILERYNHVVENRQTDGAFLRQKAEAWENIAREYNANPHAKKQVTSKQLRRLWMNLKQRQRGAQSQERTTQPLMAPSPPPDIPVGASPECRSIIQMVKNTILEREYQDRKRRADELHELELILLREKIREAKANGDLAELILEQQQTSG